MGGDICGKFLRKNSDPDSTHRNVLTIDCDVICKNADSDDRLVIELANQVG